MHITSYLLNAIEEHLRYHDNIIHTHCMHASHCKTCIWPCWQATEVNTLMHMVVKPQALVANLQDASKTESEQGWGSCSSVESMCAFMEGDACTYNTADLNWPCTWLQETPPAEPPPLSTSVAFTTSWCQVVIHKNYRQLVIWTTNLRLPTCPMCIRKVPCDPALHACSI